MTALDIGLAARPTGPDPIEEGSTGPRWSVLDRLEKTGIGTRRAGGAAAVRRREPAGCLLYGPYWQLASGAYRLHFRCRAGKPRLAGQPVLGVEAIAMNRVQLAWLDLTAEELESETGSLEFLVPPALGLGAGDEARLEFRFFHLGNSDLVVSAAELLPIQRAEGQPTPARRWRLLGRLEKTLIGRRTAQGITVRQAARPGRLLDGARPFLQLPRGNYRLSFRCTPGAAQMPAQPVLAVEILASRRWRDSRLRDWRALFGVPARVGVQQACTDFTEMQLRAGPGSVDFTVPGELSLESGQEIVFGFRFVHLGNAALTIGAVDLQQTSKEETRPTAPREWRLLGRLAKGAIGARDADCVTVRQNEPAGVLLHGGRPELLLAPGSYRLSLCCSPGLPRSASEPVLTAEAVARPRMLGARSFVRARRSVTAEELQRGSATLDFEVPAEWSRDGEQAVGFEFRIRHLGNADLKISAVDVREATPAEPLSVDRPRAAAKTRRTNLLIIGNCQAQTLHEAFVRTSELNTRIDARYHFVGLQRELHELGRAELERCELLLVQDIRDWEQYPLRPCVPDDMRIIKFPLLHFASLWPFDHYNGPGDKEAYEREWPNLTFLYHDGLLARLRKEIPDPEQRLLAYRSLSFDGILNYVRLHDFEKRRLTAMDQKFELDIGRFILDHFQHKQLFYTTNHPNGQITGMLMRYLLRQIGIGEVYPPTATLDHLKRLQVPVHPKVAKALGVKWASESTKYLYGGEQITWETYVRRYIEHYG